MRLHFREQGDGPPLIILHGLFGSLENWAFISQQLADSFRVISVDQRNHGQSPHRLEMNYGYLADDLLSLMDQLQLPAAHVMGHSMGGKAAMQLAVTHGNRVNHLIVVDIAPRQYPRKHDGIFDALLALNLSQFETRAQIEEALAPAIPEMAVRRFLLKGLAQRTPGRFSWKFNLTALHEHYSELTDALNVRGTFTGPALFIRGEKSDYIRDEDVPLIQEIFPRLELATISGSSHWVHAEAAEKFVDAVRTFLLKKF